MEKRGEEWMLTSDVLKNDVLLGRYTEADTRRLICEERKRVKVRGEMSGWFMCGEEARNMLRVEKIQR